MTKFKHPTHIKFTKHSNFMRLKYCIDGLRISSEGFCNKKEFMKVIKNQGFFKVEELKRYPKGHKKE